MQIRNNPAGRNPLTNLFKGTGVELGTERGRYAEKIAQVCDKLYCVDLWKAYGNYRQHVTSEHYEEIMQSAKDRLAKYNVELIREDIDKAAELFEDESLDFFYLDGNHEEADVKRNLRSWWDKVKVGGIISGHDYSGVHGKGVRQAVHDVCAEKGVEEITVWRGDSSASYHIVKP